MPLTVAAVPTGMNAGVSITPCGVSSRPSRAPDGSVFSTSKRKDIAWKFTSRNELQVPIGAGEKSFLRFFRHYEDHTVDKHNVVLPIRRPPRMKSCGITVHRFFHQPPRGPIRFVARLAPGDFHIAVERAVFRRPPHRA